ncbi:hypothetical protein [Mucilaginibacter sp.]|uniref:hypothetical protein n=1 Tax=Mucilaginibacter sp. TaxID=1882438 RepID=UPI003D0A3B9F
MNRLCLITTILFIPYCLKAQLKPLPAWITTAFRSNKLDSKFELKENLKPAYLKADFNGDGVNDIAVMVKDKKSGKLGILLMLGNNKRYEVFGAGNKLGKAGFDATDDLKWVQGWEIYNKPIAYETKFDNGDIIGSTKRKLTNKAINIWSVEDGEPLAGELITWNGKEYTWIHQGE